MLPVGSRWREEMPTRYSVVNALSARGISEYRDARAIKAWGTKA
jgi:hypothetical protein